MIDVMTSVYNMIWKTGELPMDSVIGDYTPKERKLTAVPELSNNQSH